MMGRSTANIQFFKDGLGFSKSAALYTFIWELNGEDVLKYNVETDLINDTCNSKKGFECLLVKWIRI